MGKERQPTGPRAWLTSIPNNESSSYGSCMRGRTPHAGSIGGALVVRDRGQPCAWSGRLTFLTHSAAGESRGGGGTSSSSVRIRRTIDTTALVRRSAVGSPGGLV